MKEMYKGKVNSPATQLTEAIDLQTKNIKVDDASVLPAGPNLAVIGTDGNAETIKYESINNNILVGCTRGFQGEIRVWDKGSLIARNFTEHDLNTLQENIKELEDSKISKVDGQGLISDDEKEKLKNIESGANKYTHPSTHLASMITENTLKRFVTDAEKEKWNNKVDTKIGYGLSKNDYTDSAKSKVDAIPANPKYTDTKYDDTQVKQDIQTLKNGQLSKATQSEAETGTNNSKYMTPQSTKQAIQKLAPEPDLSGYVQKDGSKVLSTNDYTNADKQKVNSIPQVEDSLQSTSTTKALSSRQGKILNDSKVDKSTIATGQSSTPMLYRAVVMKTGADTSNVPDGTVIYFI